MGVVIVAIPSSDDRVWSVSSEKKPHLTLLYLGDDVSPEAAAQISKFVEHAAATVLNRFYLEIDKRGTLGKDNADVVFFEGWDLPDLKRFRSYLLMDNTIKKTYLAAEQFPDWLPHLTLGYPTKPAKKLKDDGDRLYSIHFDKIAVWFGDFGGPEFELKKVEYPEMAMGATSLEVSDILKHYGTKGMKWGQRKTETRADNGKKVTPKKLAKLDKKFDRDASDFNTLIKINNKAADGIQPRLKALNDKATKEGHDFTKPSAARDKYNEEARTLFAEEYAKAANTFTNASGTKTYDVQFNDDFSWSVFSKDVKHADGGQKFTLTRNARGLIVKVTPALMEHSDIFIDEYLAHFGVKGMKWGVRKQQIKSGLKSAGSFAKAFAKEVYLDIADQAWEQQAYSPVVKTDIHNTMAERFNRDITKLNSKPKYNKDLNDPKNYSLLKQYDKEAAEIGHKAMEHAAREVVGKSPSGRKEAFYDRRTQQIVIRPKGGKHVQEKEFKSVPREPDFMEQSATAQDIPDLTLKLRIAPTGHVIQVNYAKSKSMAQVEELVGDFLEHYGTKGMKWGVRKADAPAPGTVRVTDKKKKLKAEGGKGFETHPDAVKAATSKQKMKKSGAKTLSNNELRELATRLNLEKQVRELSVADKQANQNPAARFVKGLLKNSGKQEAQKASNSLASKGVETMMKK